MNRYLAAAVVVVALLNSALLSLVVSSASTPHSKTSLDSSANSDGASARQDREHGKGSAVTTFLEKTVTDPVSLFTAVLALVAIVQGFFLLESNRTARIAADASRDSVDAQIAAEQPYLVINGNITTAHFEGPRRGTAPDVELTRTVEFGFRNNGRSPAVIKEVTAIAWFNANWVPSDVAPTRQKVWFGTILMPDQSTGPAPVSLVLTSAQLTESCEGGKENGRVFLRGSVVYENYRGDGYKTVFCLRHDHQRSGFVIHPSRRLNYQGGRIYRAGDPTVPEAIDPADA